MRRLLGVTSRCSVCGLGVAALLLFAEPAGAQLIDEEPVGRFTIGGSVGALFPGMNEVNKNLGVANVFLRADDIRSLDKVDVAVLSGLDVRYKLSDRLSIGATWGAVNARSQFDVARVDVRFFTRATLYQGAVYYHLPGIENLDERAQVYAGGGVLLLRNALVEWSLEDRTRNSFLRDADLAELSGSGAASGDASGFTLLFGGSFQLNSKFSVAVDAGWRFATMDQLELSDVEGQFERFGLTDDDDDEPDDIIREPGDWAIWDFFLRDPAGRTNDGRDRTDPLGDQDNPGGCAGCPLYYTGGPLEVDYSGPFTQLSFRLHLF